MAISHIALQFAFGNQGRYRVDNHHVQSPTAYQHFTDFQGLFSRIWLGHQQLVYIDTQVGGILWIQSMLSIDEGCTAAGFLSLCDNMER